MHNNRSGAASAWYPHHLIWLLLTAAVIVLDQLTKWWAVALLEPYHPEKVISVFNFTLAYNYGAAFSFLAGAGGWQRWFFTALAIVASVVILIWMARLKPHEKWQAVALSLVLGGAIGNVIDRVRLGYVVDFLDFHWGASHFPAFNLADSAITLGAILIAIELLFASKHHEQ